MTQGIKEYDQNLQGSIVPINQKEFFNSLLDIEISSLVILKRKDKFYNCMETKQHNQYV